jgi:hypothetical protein
MHTIKIASPLIIQIIESSLLVSSTASNFSI